MLEVGVHAGEGGFHAGIITKCKKAGLIPWVKTRNRQYSPQVDQPCAIQLQHIYGSPPNRRNTQDLFPVLRPCEMISPVLEARIKQHSRSAGFRIYPVRFGMFTTIATETSPRQVFQDRLSSALAWMNMIN